MFLSSDYRSGTFTTMEGETISNVNPTNGTEEFSLCDWNDRPVVALR
jgi:hypothetical protein